MTGWKNKLERAKRELGQLERDKTPPFQLLPPPKQTMGIIVHERLEPAAFPCRLYRFFLEPSRLLGLQETGEEDWPQKEREKREISHDFFFFFGASQPGSQPVHHEASQPASKQANQFISFSGATGTGPSHASEQRATVLHHFLSERPRRLQLLIARLCQSAAQGLQPAGLFTACSHYITPLCSAPIQAGLSFQVHKRSRCTSKE